MFGKIHPRFRTPWVAIGVYGLAGMMVAALGQAGTTVRGAYDVLVSMGIIDFLYSVICSSSRPWRGCRSGRPVRMCGRSRVRKPVAMLLAAVGFLSTMLTIVLSVIPADEEPNKPLAVAKVLISTVVLIGGGALLFLVAEKKRRTLLEQRATASGK